MFPLGRTVATPAALAALEAAGTTPAALLARHHGGDWGELCPDDVEQNRRALADGSRLLSSYRVGEQKVWVITEADRSATTILLPEDY